jgi:hypothetical protein
MRASAVDVQFDEIELLFLGQYVFNVWLELGVLFKNFGADRALGTGFDLGFGARGYAAHVSRRPKRATMSRRVVLLLLKHGEKSVDSNGLCGVAAVRSCVRSRRVAGQSRECSGVVGKLRLCCGRALHMYSAFLPRYIALAL